MKIVVKIFQGLDVLYFWHRLLAMFTTSLIFIHATTSISNFQAFTPNIIILGVPAEAGELARNGFIILIVVALLAKFIKYEHFRFIHRLLIIPYIFALYHGIFSSWINLFGFDALSIWMLTTSLIGISSSLYMMLAYQRTAFKFNGEIVDKVHLGDNIIELKVKMNKNYQFQPGQFAFIKIFTKGISSQPHPFSISGVKSEYIYFTIKALGDYTSELNKSLITPSKIKITRPFGRMTFTSKNKQVWVAGGIGITPFLGYLRSVEKIDRKIHLYYSVRKKEEAVHLEFLNQLSFEQDNFSFTLFEASSRGYLTAKNLDLDNQTTVYMCGPRPMVKSLEKQIKIENQSVEIEYEAFSFTGTLVDDIMRIFKQLVKRLKVKKTT